MTQAVAPNVRIAPFPWSIEPINQTVDALALRPSLITSTDVYEVRSDVCDGSLPELASWRDADGVGWRKFELPAAQSTQESVGFEEMQLTILSDRCGSVSGHFAIPNAMFRASDDALPAEEDDTLDSGVDVSVSIQGVIDSHLDFVNSVFDRARPHRMWWEANIDGIAYRSVKRAVSVWSRTRSEDEPRLALIVKLARDLPATLTDVCQRPRVTLRRVRQMQSVDKLQELDTACLRWIARQPGRDLLEKAGPKQRILAVQRVENTDTPENRVVRDFIRRATRECRRYLAEHRAYADHYRVRTVRRFLRLLTKLAGEMRRKGVRPLVGIAQPNYVLQHEPRYHELWSAYRLLVRQQKQQDSAWRWRHRTWSEVCEFAILAAMDRLASEGTAYRGDLLFRDEQVGGRFVDPRTEIGRWIVDGRRRHTVSLIDPRSEPQASRLDRELRLLTPDFVLQHQSDSSQRSLGIWCALDRSDSSGRLARLAESLYSSLSQLPPQISVRGLVFLSSSNQTETAAILEAEKCAVLQMPINLLAHVDTISERLMLEFGD